MILLINKNNLFNEKMIKDFEMVEYENFAEKTIYVEKDAFKHYEMLKAHLKIEGIIIDINDGYRSLESQESLFLRYMNKYGIDEAEKLIAMPGTSDHHTGQAIDLIIKKGDEWINEYDQLWTEIETFEKIKKVLKYFGFVLRYPKGKEVVTGFAFEPWHIRYVGEDEAIKIGDLTLEEYIELK